MRTYSPKEAQSAFDVLIERAADGEPQRVALDGRDSVIQVAEWEWLKGEKSAATLVELFLRYAGDEGFEDVVADSAEESSDRPLV